MTEAFLVDAIRTPVAKGRATGALHALHPVDLLGGTLDALVRRTGVDPAELDDVIIGCVGQVGEQSSNIGRTAVLAAGFPESVPATTVDRQCGSSQQAAAFAAQGVMAGVNDLVVAGGVESMSRVTMGSQTLGQDRYGRAVRARYADGLVEQGISAELIAERWKLSRTELDEFAAESHRRAADAARRGILDREIVPVVTGGGDGDDVRFTADDGIRPDTTVERLAGLRAAFATDEWPDLDFKVTAGNSSQISDGAAAALIASPTAVSRLGLTPRARFHSFAVAGDDPVLMLTAIIPATRRILDRAGLSLADMDVIEVNEAFASVVLAWQRDLDADLEKVNVHGGAIAIGHPLGASGGRLLATLLNALEQRDGRFGLQVMCEAGGLANATIIERLS
jgi:acetyl-CoA acyltransferase